MKFELPPPLPDDLTVQRRRREKRQPEGTIGNTPELAPPQQAPQGSWRHPRQQHPNWPPPPAPEPPSPASRKSRHHGFLLVGLGILIIVVLYSLWWLNNRGSLSRSQAPNSSAETPSATASGNSSEAAPNAMSSPTSSPTSQEDPREQQLRALLPHLSQAQQRLRRPHPNSHRLPLPNRRLSCNVVR